MSLIKSVGCGAAGASARRLVSFGVIRQLFSQAGINPKARLLKEFWRSPSWLLLIPANDAVKPMRQGRDRVHFERCFARGFDFAGQWQPGWITQGVLVQHLVGTAGYGRPGD